MYTTLEHAIVKYFGGIPTKGASAIAEEFLAERFKKGTLILDSTARNHSLVFVLQGYLRLYSIVDGKEITQWIVSPGGFATDLAGLVFNEPARLNIQALTDVEVMVLSKSAYDALGDKIENWTSLEKLFIVGCFAHLENRVNNHLSLTAEQRYDLYFESNKTLFNHVPLHYIASMLGMTPETFSRIRKKEACDFLI